MGVYEAPWRSAWETGQILPDRNRGPNPESSLTSRQRQLLNQDCRWASGLRTPLPMRPSGKARLRWNASKGVYERLAACLAWVGRTTTSGIQMPAAHIAGTCSIPTGMTGAG